MSQLAEEEAYIFVGGREIKYLVKKSARARRLRLAVHAGGRVVVTIPSRGVSLSEAHAFVQKQATWIVNAQACVPAAAALPSARERRKDFLHYAPVARALVQKKLKELNVYYGHTYGRVSVRNTSTRWGSCSRKGNLNFNYRIIFLPEHLCNYVVVHELCHLKEFNHSRAFWQLVSRRCPDYQKNRAELRREFHV